MKRGLVLVEGETEEELVTRVLSPHFEPMGLSLTPKIVETKRRRGRVFKGGVSTYGKIERDLRRLLGDRGAAVITSMFDYYGLPDDFPGRVDAPAATARARVAHLEAAWNARVGDSRFVPHLTLHEVEAWVFADPLKLEPWMLADDVTVADVLAGIAARFASPEDINEGPETHPSKRLESVFVYQKTTHARVLVGAVGLDAISRTCPHAAVWLDRLEAIAAAT